jgi:hypothetical protein
LGDDEKTMNAAVLGAWLWMILPILAGVVLVVFGLPYWWTHYRPADQGGLAAWLPGIALFAGLVLVAVLVAS